jgi:uncharacterized protein YbjT (DUF2867 family)
MNETLMMEEVHMTKKALVAGATGLIGTELIRYMVHQNHYDQIHVLLRKPLNFTHTKLVQHQIDFEQLDQYATLFKVNDVFCCLGTTIAKAKTQVAFTRVDKVYPVQMAQLAYQNGAQQFFVVSSISANARSKGFYLRTKGEMEQAVQAIPLNGVHIFRPSLLLGQRSEFRLGERVGEQLAKIIPFVFQGKRSLYHPIQAKEVAQAMLRIAKHPSSGVNIYHYDEMINDLKV